MENVMDMTQLEWEKYRLLKKIDAYERKLELEVDPDNDDFDRILDQIQQLNKEALKIQLQIEKLRYNR